jgi:hypothetical protein
MVFTYDDAQRPNSHKEKLFSLLVFFLANYKVGVTPIHLRACSVSSQSMWIEWDWMGLNPKQVKLLLNFFTIPSNPHVLGITEQALNTCRLSSIQEYPN